MYVNISVMSAPLKANQHGYLNVLLVPLIMAAVFLLIAIGFGVWSFAGREDYKKNSDQKSDAAVAVAVQRTKSDKDNEFVQKEKEPLKSYAGPAQYGSINLRYPKTWSVYADEQPEKLSLLMQPDVVSSNASTPYSLKIEVMETAYAQVITQLDNDIKQGKLRASAFSLAKVPDVLGLRVDGQITQKKTGSAIYLPLRDSTIIISAEAPDKVQDLNNIILPNLQFTP